MRSRMIRGHVTLEQWQQVAAEDDARRSGLKETDFRSSILTAASGVLILAMLATGPMWTVIHLGSNEGAHGPLFDRLWLLPFALTLAAVVPLAWAIARERSLGRFALSGFLALSLAIQLLTNPWF